MKVFGHMKVWIHFFAMFCSSITSLLGVNPQASNLLMCPFTDFAIKQVCDSRYRFMQLRLYKELQIKCIALKAEVAIEGFFAFIYHSVSFNK